MALKASSHGEQTGVRVVMGSDTVTERPPANGLVVTGRAASLDAIDWISLARTTSSDADMPPLPGQPAIPKKDAVPLQQVDVQADRLLMIGGVFPQTRLRLRPTRDAVAVTLAGPRWPASSPCPPPMVQPCRAR